MREFGINLDRTPVNFVEPLGFFDFIRLEQTAFCVLSDSGTVQEETCILGVPNVTLRDVTERPETIECGSSLLAGCEVDRILKAVEIVTEGSRRWQPPPEYLMPHVADTVIRIVLGFRAFDSPEARPVTPLVSNLTSAIH
jgi:UDP-N-acetylglucosamine 2-epimerase (non-hydrolysing)